jgi:hypothetical protein
MSKDFVLFLQIMFFYAILSHIVAPSVVYNLSNKSYKYTPHAIVLGCAISLALWNKFGQNIIANKQSKGY